MGRKSEKLTPPPPIKTYFSEIGNPAGHSDATPNWESSLALVRFSEKAHIFHVEVFRSRRVFFPPERVRPRPNVAAVYQRLSARSRLKVEALLLFLPTHMHDYELRVMATPGWGRRRRTPTAAALRN
ncbi:hypothetical protein MTP99_010002 [Tenebrio molitor]|jgi:hypothetical protein|uniref:Uncharacterized protein n=1 Tax=Tenebrio molitor TaxID=7067 RepID=A0A8J6LC87_TENMO|nr:hypothetical protein GEV33_007583 [Tenebrio molitor]KAJ3633027.1 hypothetical protein MTP99_010002 [Tenebrio molitor]